MTMWKKVGAWGGRIKFALISVVSVEIGDITFEVFLV